MSTVSLWLGFTSCLAFVLFVCNDTYWFMQDHEAHLEHEKRRSPVRELQCIQRYRTGLVMRVAALIAFLVFGVVFSSKIFL